MLTYDAWTSKWAQRPLVRQSEAEIRQTSQRQSVDEVLSFRLAVMANRSIGQAVLSFMLRTNPDHLAAIVLTDDDAWSTFEPELFKLCPEWVERLTWRTRSQLKQLSLDAILLAWWPFILKGSDLDLAPTILNMHPSLLPHCRGKDPNFWALVEGRPFGVTIHRIDGSIDGGPMAFQREIPVTWEDTGETLYRAAEREIVALFVDNYGAIAKGDIPALGQRAEAGSFHTRRELDAASKLDLDRVMPVRDVLNLLRARTFPPHPGCRFLEDDEEFEVAIEIRRVQHAV